MLSDTKIICKLLYETYDTNLLKKYPIHKDIFFKALDLYKKNPDKFPQANKTLMSLIYNLENPEYQPIVDYITGPGEISKYISIQYNKVIYLFGENNHNNNTGCIQSNLNMIKKKHMKIQNYLLSLFEHSPVFIDFYVEFGIMLDSLQTITKTSGQTIWDMLFVMKGCLGPVNDRNCPYNVRIHSVDVRDILSKKYKSSKLSQFIKTLMMENVLHKKNKGMDIKIFKEKYKPNINLLSNIKTSDDLVKLITSDIKNNKFIMKKIKRSTISEQKIMDFFILNINEKIHFIPQAGKLVGDWFENLKNSEIWLNGIQNISYILILVNSIIMDIYTVSRMFKVFNIKKTEHYPKEPHNIIYYAGNGHTQSIALFLENIGFLKSEQSDKKMISCVDMKNIKQPLFS